MIIFGWGHRKTKDYGPTAIVDCANCKNKDFWHLVHLRDYFTLLFIPVFPYESKHYLLCKVCSKGIELSKAGTEHAKKLNQATASYLAQQMSQEVYEETVARSGLFKQ